MTPAQTAIAVVVGGGLFTILGARITSRSDHRRWLREERFGAYAALLTASSHVADIQFLKNSIRDRFVAEHDVQAPQITHEQVEEIIDGSLRGFADMLRAEARVQLVGPPDVAELGIALRRAATHRWAGTTSDTELIAAEKAFVDSCQRTLGSER